jgi:hypothetical protein
VLVTRGGAAGDDLAADFGHTHAGRKGGAARVLEDDVRVLTAGEPANPDLSRWMSRRATLPSS